MLVEELICFTFNEVKIQVSNPKTFNFWHNDLKTKLSKMYLVHLAWEAVTVMKVKVILMTFKEHFN